MASVFLLGPGYLGLTIIENLLAANYKVSTLVRSPESASKLGSIGVHTIAGTLEDGPLITEQVIQHEIIINCSSSDHVQSVRAILSGIRQRVQAGLSSTFIHTSGTGLLCDNAKGAYKTDIVYSDDNPSMIDALPSTALHRNVDLTIVEAAREFGDKAKLVITIAPVIYGINPNNDRISFALPTLVKFALKHGFSGRIGKGENTWSCIHVNDLARAYMTLLAYLESPASSETVLSNPYFFADNGAEFVWGKFAELVGRVLHQMGKISTEEVKPFEEKHYPDVFGPITEFTAGGNSRTKSVRLANLGWRPTEKDVLGSMEEDEIPFILGIQK
ncbi:NAD(P)-binding protein [Periconia macrospinosa]|uniref:NAD(P)-binding protein n=1 Tax=Periconia macrospinosa TaxID=97972 RepID=A0A2V1DP32_9PLEO|nr:NAD(P)-binding protein [Periconia macrospinosa]